MWQAVVDELVSRMCWLVVVVVVAAGVWEVARMCLLVVVAAGAWEVAVSHSRWVLAKHFFVEFLLHLAVSSAKL